MSIPHQINIVIHIIAGSAALLLGLAAILTKKGGRWHKKSGRLFLVFLSVIIATGLAGVFVFGRNTFLLVITMLSAYLGVSGYRILKAKSNKPKALDIAIGVISLLIVFYFLHYIKSIGLIWSPVIIYSTVGYLLLMITYDFARYFIPRDKYGNMWLYEHIIKMVGAFSGILSAFTGTVFPQYQPYSQFLPSTFGTLLGIGFVIYVYHKKATITGRAFGLKWKPRRRVDATAG